MLAQQLLQLHLIDGKIADPLGQLLGGHCILILLPAELAFTQRRWLGLNVCRGMQPLWYWIVAVGQIFEQGWAYGQSIATGKCEDLIAIAEAGSHDHGRVAVLFVIVIDAGDGYDPRILMGQKLCGFAVALVPVEEFVRQRER